MYSFTQSSPEFDYLPSIPTNSEFNGVVNTLLVENPQLSQRVVTVCTVLSLNLNVISLIALPFQTIISLIVLFTGTIIVVGVPSGVHVEVVGTADPI